jgi:hypothetical protein
LGKDSLIIMRRNVCRLARSLGSRFESRSGDA